MHEFSRPNVCCNDNGIMLVAHLHILQIVLSAHLALKCVYISIGQTNVQSTMVASFFLVIVRPPSQLFIEQLNSRKKARTTKRG